MKKVLIVAGLMSCLLLAFSVQAQQSIKQTPECIAYNNYKQQIENSPISPNQPGYQVKKFARENKLAALKNKCEASVVEP